MANATLRQTWALMRKNLIINLRRQYFSTVIRAFIFPILFVAIVSFSRNILLPPSNYGVGSPAPILSLRDAVAAEGKKNKLMFVNNGLGGEVDQVISRLQNGLTNVGNVTVLTDPKSLREECQSNLNGVSPCFAAVVFESSPNTNGSTGNGTWKYLLRGDNDLNGLKVDAFKHDNPVQKILLPLQLSVDQAIARQSGYTGPDLVVEEFMYTNLTNKEFDDRVREQFAKILTNYLSAAYQIGMIGVVYHLVGFQAMERERGLSTLIEAMGGSKMARMMAYQTAFTIMYIIGWIVISFSLWGGLLQRSSLGIVLIWHLLAGLAFTSWAMFLGSIFKKAQLSGILSTVLSLALGVIAQIANGSSTAAVAILSFLFPPMNYIYHFISIGRFEGQGIGASAIKAAPGSSSQVPLIAFWIFSVVQFIFFPIAAAYIEKYLFGTESPGHRYINGGAIQPGNAVELRSFTKRYHPRLLTRLFGKRKEPVLAVNGLTLDVLEGQILVLLGANGSGKTTTLEAIAGLASVREGDISIATGEAGGIGICPQKNVLWDDMTVEEHVRIWNLIKCKGDDEATLEKLIEECDLTKKRKAQSKTLSGGQKRKLQLAAMLTGGSNVCAIDEVSSGLDPLSRRKIWDIILAVRGSRTIILTSHFLDEADLLADHIAILSKGQLKCEGSAVELKTQYGGGYRVHAPIDSPAFEGVAMQRFYDKTIYNIADASEANRLIEALEKSDVSDYYVTGPSIEDVFLKVAGEGMIEEPQNAGSPGKLAVPAVAEEISATTSAAGSQTDKGAVGLHNGIRTSVFSQVWSLIRKRITILQRGYLPTIAAIVIPIIAALATMPTFSEHPGISCGTERAYRSTNVQNLKFDANFKIVLGPAPNPNITQLMSVASVLFPGGESAGGMPSGLTPDSLLKSFHYVDTIPQFTQYITENYKNVTPGGMFIDGNKATYAFLGLPYLSLFTGMTIQSLVSNLAFQIPGGITAHYQAFDYIWPAGQGQTLLFITYTCLAFSVFPAFFILYPAAERLRKVRALHYSNGVRAFPLWLAYTIFDFIVVILISAVCVGLFSAATSGWYHLPYVFVVMILYGLASILMVYCISLFMPSQLSAFAVAAGGQAAMFLIYLITYMSITSIMAAADAPRAQETSRYVLGAISPIVNLLHALFVSLNSFRISCDGQNLISYPGIFKLYGSSITFLICQIGFFFTILLLNDTNRLRLPTRSVAPAADVESHPEKAIHDEAASVNGLIVDRVSKSFAKFQAVENISFSVPPSSVYALLGPNGAGKTTTINMIRADLKPTSGSINVCGIPSTNPMARTHLGVCPQFDAIDRMTVYEHLVFYARIRGVKQIEYNVDEALRAVGLEPFRHRIAEQLSGGNKRKLSLAIALMGNPAVLLLDEPSSGMDALAKRRMWRTLEGVGQGRAVVLTTHSMEECSALASKAGIMKKRMLAEGTVEQLRKDAGDKYLLHLVLGSAPHSTPEEMRAVKNWVQTVFRNAEVEEREFGGQLRVLIPAGQGGIREVFRILEKQAAEQGVRYWSVDRGTMDMVFLEVVGREQDEEKEVKESEWNKWAVRLCAPWLLLVK
ncbi:hypothetical protein BZA77DRAFT_359663 [Pyronema omphalodes]|nr:hypothetical protein BZA77DRAFT_359663 [Pyronema omphalodes]